MRWRPAWPTWPGCGPSPGGRRSRRCSTDAASGGCSIIWSPSRWRSPQRGRRCWPGGSARAWAARWGWTHGGPSTSSGSRLSCGNESFVIERAAPQAGAAYASGPGWHPDVALPSSMPRSAAAGARPPRRRAAVRGRAGGCGGGDERARAARPCGAGAGGGGASSGGGGRCRRAFGRVPDRWLDARRPYAPAAGVREYAGRADWARLHVFFGDERQGAAGRPPLELPHARESLLDHVPVPAGKMHPLTDADQYEGLLRAFFGERPRFDLLMPGHGGRRAHGVAVPRVDRRCSSRSDG